MRSRRAFRLLLLLGLLGCSASAREEAQTRSAPAKAEAVTAKSAPTVAPQKSAPSTKTESITATDPSSFKLASAGAGKKRTLRYAFKAGDSFTSSLEITIASEGAAALRGRAQDTKLGTTMNVELAVKVEEVDSSGNMVLSARSHHKPSAEIPAHARAGMGAPALEQLNMRWTISPRGFVVRGQSELPADTQDTVLGVLDRIHSSLQELTPPLPEEPVGKGARFLIKRTIVSGGTMTLSHEATYTLKEVNTDDLPYEVTVAQSAPKQGSDGVSFERWTGNGKGRGTLHLKVPRFDHEESISQNIQLSLPIQARAKIPNKVAITSTSSIKVRPRTP